MSSTPNAGISSDSKNSADAKYPKIDLSASGAMEFTSNKGKCADCKGFYPLLAEVGLCKMCIFVGLLPIRFQQLNNPEFIAPKGYREKESASSECPICFVDLRRDKLNVTCFECRESFHIDCYKMAGNAKCPVCRSEFSLA